MNRNFSIDILKLMMAFMVVGLHAGFLGEYSSLAEYLTVNGLFRIAVPVFLLINGFYFFPVLVENSQIQWLKRVFVLYVIWMFIYSGFWFLVPDLSLDSIVRFATSVVIGYWHLWYISGMIGAAIILIALKRSSSFVLASTALILFTVGVFIQYSGNYHSFGDGTFDKLFNKTWFHRNALFFSFPFFCIGYLINKHKLHEAIDFRTSCVISVVGFLFLFLESYFNYFQNDRDGGFDNYFSLLIVCPFLFLFFLRLNIGGDSKKIALYSSSIYFVHVFFLIILEKYTSLKPTMLTLSCVLISAAASYFIIKINKKVGYIL